MADPDSEKRGVKFIRKYTRWQFFCRLHAGTHRVVHLFIMLPLLKVYNDLMTAEIIMEKYYVLLGRL